MKKQDEQLDNVLTTITVLKGQGTAIADELNEQQMFFIK